MQELLCEPGPSKLISGHSLNLPDPLTHLKQELETSARDKMSGSEQDLSHCDLTFSLPNDEVLNATKWSNLLKLEDLPTIKVVSRPCLPRI